MKKPITPAELEIMRIIWEHGTLKPGEIHEHFQRTIHNATLRTLLRILVEKGHVTRRRRGRAFFYSARTRKEGEFQRSLGRLLKDFCDGSPLLLVSKLLDAEDLSQEERQKIQEIADQQDKSEKRTKKGA